MTNTVEVLIDDARHIVIPAALRQQLGLSVGMTLVVEDAQSGDAVLRVAPQEPTVINKGSVLVVQSALINGIEQIVKNDRETHLNEQCDVQVYETVT